MIAPVNLIRWKPARVARVLGMAALLRAMPAPLPIAGPGESLIASAHVLCIGGDQSDGDAPTGPHHEGCDACCLPGGRIAGILPESPSVVVVLLPQRDRSIEIPLAFKTEARAPPFEAWSQERAQRGPPDHLIA